MSIREDFPQGEKPKFTGRQLVMFRSGNSTDNARNLAEASIHLANSNDYRFDDTDFNKAFAEADGIIFDKLNVAVVNKEKKQTLESFVSTQQAGDEIMYTEPERFVYALDNPSVHFMQGYKTAVDHLASHFSSIAEALPEAENTYYDDDTASWGIHATGVPTCTYTGKGVRIAILDTGFFDTHPDFAQRSITTKSFINVPVTLDPLGHGSHCVGISSGNCNTQTNRRYGVAKDAGIYAGRVLDDQGIGVDGNILAGMEWAINNDCRVISMSLGAPVAPGEGYSNFYNDLANRAFDHNTIIIAAAGNDSKRQQGICRPVNHPANCPAIMAVAALDNNLQVGNFSCAGINQDGGQVDIAAPGVNVYSSWISPDNYKSISGTSMATPFVAGIAALFFEANPQSTAREIWTLLTQHAKRLPLSSVDAGAGLVQVP